MRVSNAYIYLLNWYSVDQHQMLYTAVLLKFKTKINNMSKRISMLVDTCIVKTTLYKLFRMVTLIQTTIPPPCFVDMADVNIALSILPGCRSELRKQSGRHPGIPQSLHYPALLISRQHVKYFFVSSFISPSPCFSHFVNRWRMLMLHPRVFHISEKLRMRPLGRVSKLRIPMHIT